jgi:hypothetical protein
MAQTVERRGNAAVGGVEPRGPRDLDLPDDRRHNPTLTLQALAWRTAERLVELTRGH